MTIAKCRAAEIELQIRHESRLQSRIQFIVACQISLQDERFYRVVLQRLAQDSEPLSSATKINGSVVNTGGQNVAEGCN
eukprot:CAMPEP_0206331516 /NCGR_PEP_ID=MMETSP0106_2-20121207/24286_1 /ASSEMBLY_ACC=CAM_ASM_000206 /TAXON_ID=81532 /ORGANISM="Acanthoeca-like sp., Strain 10tr" /LENGTH=78 /DNA_ID=CAMNT_0053764331 /DNA_START=280 /DNA_END=516 /DNA_ORIENTATION=+